MSVRTMAKVWECSGHSGSELLMLLAIADFADDDGKAYPSVATLAKKCRMKPRNANYILKALQDSGELRVHVGEGPHGTNLYRINMQTLQHSAGVQCIAPPLHCVALPPAMECAQPLHSIAAKPSKTRQEPPKPLPDWVPVESWQSWVELRKQLRKPLTDRAKDLAIKKLGELRSQGYDAAQVLDQSVLNGWQGLFEIRAANKGASVSATPWEGAQ